MRKINEKNFENIFPQNIIEVRKLNEESKIEYFKKYNLYRELLTKFIIEELNLFENERRIKESGLNFVLTQNENMDFYQFFSSDYLNFFYIRNNLYIERLNGEEQEIFQEIMNNGDIELNDKIRDFIKKTYPKLIVENFANTGENELFFYGPISMNFVAPNNALVLGMRYEEFAESELTDDEWKVQNIKQMKLLEEIFHETYQKATENLEVPFTILRYSKYSVTKMKKEDQQ